VLRLIARCSPVLLALSMMQACTESVTPPPLSVPTDPHRTLVITDQFDPQPMVDDFPYQYSIDSTSTSPPPGVQYDVSPLSDGSAIVCRDHFKPIDLWWSPPGQGLISFHLNPPLLLVSKGPGTYTDRKGQIFANAVYESLSTSYATDGSGQQWAFSGRFTAYCKNGNLEIGPIIIGGQMLIALSPVDQPWRVGSSGEGTCNYSQIIYDPDQQEPCPGGGGGGGGGGDDPSGSSCTSEFIVIEVSYDNGATWSTWWQGYANVCS